MADTIKPRTFVKKGPNGETLTREVTTASSEVEATYDGYHEQTSKSSGGSKSSTSSH